MIQDFFYAMLHVDQTLAVLHADYGIWFYLILFLIIFSETAFVVTPFLPGDSLLFAIGAMIASIGEFSLSFFLGLLMAAAILGNQCNYWIGKYIGNALVDAPFRWTRWLKLTERINAAHRFYDRHGGKALVISRFIPILRSFAPFVAGLSEMPLMRFVFFNVAGGVLWVASLLVLGFSFGSVPWVKANFTLLVYAIIGVSLLPAVISCILPKS